MAKLFIGKPPQQMIDWWRERLSKTDISSLSICLDYAVDQNFQGNIIQYYSDGLSAFSLEYEPLLSIAQKGNVAQRDFCLGEISDVAIVHKMSDNFTVLGEEFREAIMLEQISAGSIAQIQNGVLSGNCNLRRASFPKLSSIDSSTFSGCLNLEHVELQSLQHIAGLAFSTNANLKTVDFGAQMSSIPKITSVSSSRVSSFISSSKAVIEAPAYLSSQFMADQVWSQVLSSHTVVWRR